MPPRRRKQQPTESIADHHSEWLSLLRPDGPFLALSVLTEALPQGLEQLPADLRDEIRRAWAQVQQAPDLLLAAWREKVLHDLLGFPPDALVPGATVEALRGHDLPDLVAYGPDPDGRAIRLLIFTLGWNERIDRGNPAPLERAAAVCRRTGVPLALITNGRLWTLVHARPGEVASSAGFDADLWSEEPLLLRAFATLLGAHRSLLPPRRPDGAWTDGLTALFARSAEARTQVTDTLGRQVRQAVELLVGELARLDRESGGALLAAVPERQIYRGALIVLMRLVFLLYAEEKELLPAGELYASSYGVFDLYERLSAERDRHGEEVADRRSAAWYRLLALFRAVHGGCEHDDLRIPAYGGSLFDPEAFPWLADAPVTDRVVHQILDALLILRHAKRGAAAERLSYKGLDVEQIGHVYEGLLEFSCLKVTEPYVGLIGKYEPELPLRVVEEERAKGETSFVNWLKERTGATALQLRKALSAAPDRGRLAALHAACDNDAALVERVRPFFGLLRSDLRGEPTVHPAGSVLFTRVGDRRATGTHYTPRSLAEEIVRHTLDPLCHRPGPAEGADEADWRVKPAGELLKLKICDPAMGSGAFLVSAVRYLAELVVQAWERDGVPRDVQDLLGPAPDRQDLVLAAKRRVAASCVYGVDRDDMAVELAKLSLWIETLAKDKPFSFLDHALRCGDSLVGLIDEAQVWSFHLDPERGAFRGAVFGNVMDDLHAMLTRAQELREEVEAFPADDIERVADKERKLAEVERLTGRLRLAADAVVAAALSTAGRPAEELDDRLLGLADRVKEVITAQRIKEIARGEERSPLEAELRATLDEWLKGPRKEPIRPFHWALEFPEVMRRGGFDAVVGNPPFIGGQFLTGAIGADMREYLVHYIGGGRRGSADLCAYFYLRDLAITNGGRVGIIATNTISQNVTRDVGLAQACDKEWAIYRAEKSRHWPGTASLEVSLVWTGRLGSGEKIFLDGREVPGITSSLDPQTRVAGSPYRLAANADKSFQGSNILGKGFILSPEEAQELIEKDPRNKDVLFPYLNGEDINSRWDLSAPRWVINFHDWDEDKARTYPDCYEIVEQKVKPFRAQNNRKVYREYWWQYAEKRPALHRAIRNLQRVLVFARVSKIGLPQFVATGQVMSEQLVVIATDALEDLALLSSDIHYFWWTVKGNSTLETRLRYTPSHGFETFPRCLLTDRVRSAGEALHAVRREVMELRKWGLTQLYNCIYDPSVAGEEISSLRDIHVEINEAVCEAYALQEEQDPGIRKFEARVASKPLPAWRDIELRHGFYETQQGIRFAISPQARDDVLDKLLALNHYRYQQEVSQGLHSGKGGRKGAKAAERQPKETEVGPGRGTDAVDSADGALDGLFAPPGALF